MGEEKRVRLNVCFCFGTDTDTRARAGSWVPRCRRRQVRKKRSIVSRNRRWIGGGGDRNQRGFVRQVLDGVAAFRTSDARPRGRASGPSVECPLGRSGSGGAGNGDRVGSTSARPRRRQKKVRPVMNGGERRQR